MKCVAIISRTVCSLFGDGVTLRSGGSSGNTVDVAVNWQNDERCSEAH